MATVSEALSLGIAWDRVGASGLATGDIGSSSSRLMEGRTGQQAQGPIIEKKKNEADLGRPP